MGNPSRDTTSPEVVQIEVLRGRLALLLSDGSSLEAGSKSFNGAIPVGVVVGLITTQTARPPNPNRLAELCFDFPLPVNWKPSLSQAISRLKRNFGLPVEAGSWKLLLSPEAVDLLQFEVCARRAVRCFAQEDFDQVITLATQSLDCWESPPYAGLGAFPLLDGAFDPHVALHKRVMTLRVRALDRQNRIAEARDALQVALEVYPGDPALRALESKLAKVVSDDTNEHTDAEVVHASHSEGLPAPTYPRFVGRVDVLEKLADNLGDRLPVLAVTGLGGTGKTAVVRFLVEQQMAVGKYSRVVWISDRTRPGTTTLETVLTQISLTLDAPALGRGDLNERSRQAVSLLTQQPTLLVIDNFETVTDSALAEWLARIPAESKAVLTAIWSPSALQGIYTEVRLGEMPEEEARDFCALHQARAGYSSEYLSGAARDRLIAACSGNPRLIEWSISHLKWQSLDQVLALVQGTSDSDGSPDVVLQELLRQSLDRISSDAKRVLMAYAHFPYGAIPSVIAGLAKVPAEKMALAIDELTGHCLLDWDRGAKAGQPSYIPEPLSRARVVALAVGPAWDEYRRSWLHHHRTIAESVGFCPEQISRLLVLDDSQTRRNIEYAIQWSLDHYASEDAVVIAREVRYWYYCRGVWSMDSSMNRAWYDLAVRCGLLSEAFDAAVYALNIAGKQGSTDASDACERRLSEIAARGFRPSTQQVVDLRHARALGLLSRGQYETAADIWSQNLLREDLTEQQRDANLRWYVQCVHKAGLVSVDFDVDTTVRDRIEFSGVRGYLRAELMLRLLAAERMLTADREVARDYLEELGTAVETCDDAMYRAQHQWLLACATDPPEDRELFAAVAVRFATLGLADRADEARRRSAGED